MREMTTNEVEMVSGGAPSCNRNDPPPYSSGSGSGLADFLKIWLIVTR